MMYVTDEIWYYIFSYFEFSMLRDDWQRDYEGDKDGWQRHGQPALLALCLVNHQLRRVAQHLLYRSFAIDSAFDLTSGNKHLYVQLLRTVAENPTLAGKIRALKFSRAERGYDTIEEVEKVLEVLNVDLESALKYRLERCLTCSCATSLLLAHTPNVELIDCTIGDRMSPMPWMLSSILSSEHMVDFKDRRTEKHYKVLSEQAQFLLRHEQRKGDHQQPPTDVVRNLSVEHNPLPSLKEVRIKAKDVSKGFIPAWTIEPILLNPNLKVLRTLGIDWYMEEEDSFKWPTHQSNLECLDLKETIAESDTLKTIMTRCPKLKSLSVDLANLYRRGDGDDDGDDEPIYDFVIDLTEFGGVLRKHGGNLEELSFSTFHHGDEYDENTMGGFGSLRELTKLRILRAEYDNLLSEFEGNFYIERFSDVLPASIETLHLFNGRRTPPIFCGPEILNASHFVKALLTEAETCTPNLRKVVVEWWGSVSLEEEFCERDWSRETIDDTWDVKFMKGNFEHEYHIEGYVMTLVILIKKKEDAVREDRG
ncbi:hypothetical protein FSPOR_3247 [Fusarium sporotrichioides]|uniref:Uncharacterized protein n=1 Tax=Fusarium sporotrichioides TaxID=5514 RepID=A0A395SGP9_FUSSP|nr:hypothetical protein FSPOR_3247 [Fusarium sporotrichioides]